MRPRPEGPCQNYAGNVCGGFGARLLCFSCGWNKFDHDMLKYGAYIGVHREQTEVDVP